MVRNIFSYSFIAPFRNCKNKITLHYRLIFQIINFYGGFTCDTFAHPLQNKYLIFFQTYFEFLVIICAFQVSVYISLDSKLFCFNVVSYQLFPYINFYHMRKAEIIEQFYFFCLLLLIYSFFYQKGWE